MTNPAAVALLLLLAAALAAAPGPAIRIARVRGRTPAWASGHPTPPDPGPVFGRRGKTRRGRAVGGRIGAPGQGDSRASDRTAPAGESVAGRSWRRPLTGGAALVLAAVVLGLPWWLGLAAGGGAVVVARKSARPRALGASDLLALAATCDLFATCIEAGLDTAAALAAVLPDPAPARRTVPGRTGRPGPPRTPAAAPIAALRAVCAMLRLGADPAAAWRPLRAVPELLDLAVAAERSATGGVRLADAARDTAARLRVRQRADATRSAARAGVAMTGPLALCFLPAFLCLGLAPVVIGLIGQVQLW